MRKMWNWLRDKMDDYELKKKMYFLYIFCVLFPLIVIDSLVIYKFINAEKAQQEYEMENIASAVQYRFYENVEIAARMARNIYTRSDVEEFLEKNYESPLDYYIGYQEFINHSWLEEFGLDNICIELYADNETLMYSRNLYCTCIYGYIRWISQIFSPEIKR